MSFSTVDENESQASTSASSSQQWSQQCRQFELSEILLATENFDESLVIGRGGFGKVYKGNINNGSGILVVAAIKRLDSMSSQGADEFWAEVEMLSKLRHCNLVSLIGYCNYGEEMILVYDYMPRGTLEDHLHKLGTSLSWLERLQICIGAARGLQYLHTGTGIETGVIHRDVKSSNILLHESWAAKISDFGLSKIGTTSQSSTYVNTLVRGTFGYLDPNYFYTGRLTRKSDVYAFGVVLFEVLCRKRAVDRSLDEDQWGLVTWVQDSIKERNLKRIIDSDIRAQISPTCLKEFVQIAERCLHSHPKQRPTMAMVVVSLESVLTIQEKLDSSFQAAGRTIFQRIIDTFSFPSFIENYAKRNLKRSSYSGANAGNSLEADHDTFMDSRELYADYTVQNLKELEFKDLKKATRNFSPDLLIGRGGYGTVFIGWVDKNTFAPSTSSNGIPVAVKRLDPSTSSTHGRNQWKAEVSVLARVTHPNIITLLGYCTDKKQEYLLVYEYMPLGTFDKFLFRPASETAVPLSWEHRLIIMIGVARGLAYLHSLKKQVIHRGVKSSDILLDEDLNAKLGDFGMARYCPERLGMTHVTASIVGTVGYLDPHYFETGQCSAKSDIYGLGAVLLETLLGLQARNIMQLYEGSLLNCASSVLEDRREIKNIMDPNLVDNYPEEGAFECAKLASRCLANRPNDRPSSEEVLRCLEQIHASNM